MTQKQSEQLIDIRCPHIVKRLKNGAEVEKACNKPIVKVLPGSKGEAYCVSCKYSFKFEVAKDNSSESSLLAAFK